MGFSLDTLILWSSLSPVHLTDTMNQQLSGTLNNRSKDLLDTNTLEEIAKARSNIPKYSIDVPKSYKIYHNHAVSSENKICSDIGSNIIRSGGNAMDAAIATLVCIGILNPFSSGIGGGGFILGLKKTGETSISFSYDFRETAPRNIDLELFRKHPASAKTGGAAVGVPGEIKGLLEAHKDYGKLPWQDLFQENIKLAKEFTATKILVEKLNRNKEYIMKDPGLYEIYTRDGILLKENEVVKRINYSRTLEALSKDPMSFYEGSIAKSIITAIKNNGGMMDEDDLKRYTAKKRKPYKTSLFSKYEVYTTPVPTSGPLVLQGLKILEHIDANKIRALVAAGDLKRLYHTLIETYKFLAAHRGEFGDPDFQDQRQIISSLLSEPNINSALKKIEQDKPLDREEYGIKCPFCEDHGTTHLIAADRDGMVVQATSTINLEFGAKFMDPNTGILFNNQIDDFYIPGVSDTLDLPKPSSNILQPGRRPFSSVAPIFLVKEDEIIAIGAAGGMRIPTAILGTVMYLMLGLGMDDAVHGVRIHEQLIPSTVFVEEFFPQKAWKSLVGAGHNLKISQRNTNFTSVQGMHILQTSHGKDLYAVSDARKDGGSSGI